MKSSRRKQTNPNRVAAGTRELQSAVTPSLVSSETSNNWKEDIPKESIDMDENSSLHPQMINREMPDYDQPLDMHVSINACVHCRDVFPSRQELHDHMLEMHGPEVKKPRVEVSLDDFPTAYHRLGRELQDITDLPLANGHLENEHSSVPPGTYSTPSPQDTRHLIPSKLSPSGNTEESLYSDPLHPLPPAAPRPSKESGSESVNGRSDRIFHMDAYCELCDREFCNKYFLKTHKANKHGIYEDNSPPAVSVPLPFPGLMIPQDPLTSFNFKVESMKPPSSEPLLPWSFKLDSPSQQSKMSDSTLGVKLVDSSLPHFPMHIPGLESPKPSLNKSSSSNSIISGNGGPCISSISSSDISPSTTSILTTITNNIKIGSTSNNTPQNPDPSMEDYCHICQKHFCNKYYLKKHKQDVHGIAPENPPITSNKRPRSSHLDLPMTPTNSMMLQQSLSSLTGMHGLHGMPGHPSMSSMHPGVMVFNPYNLPPVAIIPAGSLMPGQQIHPPHHPIISQPMSITPLPDSAFLPSAPTTSASSSNAHHLDHSPNKPISNFQDGGAHCSICSKEFCNEFYLMIHKESKHGIRRGGEDGSRDKVLPLLKENKHEMSNTPPLSSSMRHDASVTRSRSPADQASNGEGHFYCNLCSKDFNNKYLYRIHRIHDHGLGEIGDSALLEKGELQQKEDIMRSMNESLMRVTAGMPSVNHASSFGTSHSHKPQESVVCDICNKHMINQYFLRLHKCNVHGIDPSTNEKYETRPMSPSVIPSSKPRTPPSSGSLSITSPSQPLNLTPHLGKHHMLPFLTPKLDFKDISPFADFNRDFNRDFKSFRDVPSFITDTINHELFARSQNHVRHLDLNFFGLPSLGKMPGEDNLKMNFDPEAYCEICKKEFCSKYFLRTHKQNIHGIKSDTTSSSSSKGSESEKINYFSPLKPIVNNNSSKSVDGLDKDSWRWKEPANSSRVICDICNKEVCNKYFLRTHKQKKHGITPTSLSPNVSTNGSPVAFDYDTASNASSQPDDKSFKLDALIHPQMIPLPPTERLSEKFNMKPLSFVKGKDIVPLNNNNTEHSETCNICNRRFKNLNWLKDHIMKEHSDTEALDMRSKGSPPNYTCQVCGADFPAELSVQLHLIQEHNARVTLGNEEPQVPTEEASLPNGDDNSSRVAELSGRWTLRKKVSTHRRLKKYICSRCGFDTHWLSSLLDHERTEHGIVSAIAPVYPCKNCHHLFPTSNALSAHMVIVHGFTSEKALQEVKLTEPAVPNNFRCAHCPAVFPTRSWGMAHVRHVHIRSRRDLSMKNSFEKSLLRCSSCSFKTHFAVRLQRHLKCRHKGNLQTSNYIYPLPSRIMSSLQNFNNVPSPINASKEENSLLGATAMYKSIAASLLSAPETGRAESPMVDRDDLLLKSFKLPLGQSSIESTPFKLVTQTTAASAVLGL